MREIVKAGRWSAALVASLVVTGCAATAAGHAGAQATAHKSAAARNPVATHSSDATHSAVATHSGVATHTARSARSEHRQSLPLKYTTGKATKVITVVARSHSSTTAVLQAWSKSNGGWAKHGSSVTAYVGSDGLTTHPSESKSATPIGSFTLTRAFGHNSNPGTSLPYLRTTPADWWISQAGPLYNTLQICSSHCRFKQGNPNEHLYYETPYYDYAVVIDYNTRNAPGGVHQGKGSAFFLHVHPSGTGPTAGCVSIPVAKLMRLMRWLTPKSHARILIGLR